MESSLFDYHLPADRIAQEPAARRDASKLMVVDRVSRSIEHRRFADIGDYLGANDLIFRNNAKVLPARLFANRPTGGRVECLLLRPAADDGMTWWTLLRPGKRLPPGETFLSDGFFSAIVEDKNDQAEYKVRFELSRHQSVAQMAEELGKMPLPPYIERAKEDQRDQADKSRYQTVYAARDRSVAAAAPTAGLHFTPEILGELESAGAQFFDLSLHVGMGTFKPLEAEHIEDHQIHHETYEIPPDARSAIHHPQGNRRVCVGTTSVRSVEDYLQTVDLSQSIEQQYFGKADIFIYPPYAFQGVDALVTNFHLPKSTLLCLVSAFLEPDGCSGIDWLKEIYQEAIDHQYRFLSYGDAMLIL